jgi:hypothetical protein
MTDREMAKTRFLIVPGILTLTGGRCPLAGSDRKVVLVMIIGGKKW